MTTALTIDAKPSHLFPRRRYRFRDDESSPDLLALPHIQVIHTSIRIGQPDLVTIWRKIKMIEQRIDIGGSKDFGKGGRRQVKPPN
jgi:hypothetical protein